MVGHVPRPPVDLDRGIGRPHGDGRCLELGHRRVPGERLSPVFEPGGLVDEEPRRLQLRDDVGEEELDRLEVGDRPAELTALARVLHGGVERGLRDPERHRPN